MSLSASDSITLSGLIFSGPYLVNVTGSGTFELIGPASITAVDLGTSGPSQIFGYTINPTIAGSAGLTKDGPGAVTLSPGFIPNTYSGGTTINSGTLVFANENSLGAGSIVLNGGALRGMGTTSFPLSKTLFVTPGGGILDTPYIGPSSFSSGFATVSSNISGSGSLLLSSTGTSSFANSSGFNLTGMSDTTGTLSIRTPARISGTFNSASGVVVSSSVWLSVDGGTSAHIGDNAVLTLRGGGIVSDAPYPGSIGVEQVGTIVVDGGLNVIGDDHLQFKTQSLQRQNNALLWVGPAGIQINGSPPQLSGTGAENSPNVGIVSWAASFPSNISPVTVSTSGLLRPLNNAEFITTVPSGITSANLKLTSDTTISSPITINSLTVAGSVDGSGTITVSSGAIFLGTGGGFGNGISAPLNFGSARGIFMSRNFFTWLYSPISGSNGVVFTGVILAGNSTYTGTTTIYDASISSNVIPGTPGPLGLDTTPVVLESAKYGTPASISYIDGRSGMSLFGNTTSPLLFGRDLQIRSLGSGSILVQMWNASGTSTDDKATISGNIQLDGDLALEGHPGGTGFVVSGNIKGPGRLLNPSDVILSGNNTFTGGLQVGTGALMAGSDTAFGAGTVWIASNGTISAWGTPRTLNNTLIVHANPRFGGSQPLTLTGPIDLSFNTRTFEIASGGTVKFASLVSDGSLTKTGGGILQASDLNLGRLTISSGTVQIAANQNSVARIKTRVLSVAAGTTLDLTDGKVIIDYNPGFSPDSTIRPLLQNSRITSSLASPNQRVGYTQSGLSGITSFAGVAVDSSSLLMSLTYSGDTNLDGKVDLVDLKSLAQNWVQSDIFWSGGDFDYNGSVDVGDLYLLAINWQAGVSQPNAPALAPLLTSLGLPQIDVPEAGAGISGLIFTSILLGISVRKHRSFGVLASAGMSATHAE